MRDGAVYLVFGGGSGIGRAAATLAAARGARVVVADIDASVADGIEALPGDVTFVAGDSTDQASVGAVVASTVARHGRIDAVLATVGGAILGDVAEMTPETWARELDFNLTSAFRVCHAVIPTLRAQRSGAIVLTSSGQAVMPAHDRGGYAAAKAGVISYTRSLAAGLAADRVRVNCIAPGPTDTPRFRAMNGGDEGVERVRQAMPLGEIPTPEDCAEAALFLLSDAARQVTGQTLHVNGGLLMP